MNPNAQKKLIGAVIAAALAIAVYYGLIDQKQADGFRNQADQTLGTGPATQQTQQTAPQTSSTTAAPAPTTAPAPTAAPAPPASQNAEPAPRQ